MVKGSEIGILGAALRRSHGFSAESEVLGLSSRVRRAASRLQRQSEETVLDSYGPTKTAILTMLRHCRLSRTIAWPALMPARSRMPDAVRRRKRQRACAEAGAAPQATTATRPRRPVLCSARAHGALWL